MTINLGWLFATIIVCLLLNTCEPRDDTDSPTERSDLSLMTDNATGVQYLSHGWFGAPTPRLNADGSLHRVTRP